MSSENIGGIGIGAVWNFLPEPAKKVYTDVTARWQECEQKVKVWTDEKFPPVYAQKVQRLFASLPIAALTFVLPWQMSVSILAGIYLADVAYGPLNKEFYTALYNGVGTGTALMALSSGFQFFTTLSPWQLLATVIYGHITTIILPKGNLLT